MEANTKIFRTYSSEHLNTPYESLQKHKYILVVDLARATPEAPGEERNRMRG